MGPTLFDWIVGATSIISSFIPIILAFMTAAFMINVIRFFIIESGNQAGREKARKYLLWSLIGFVVVFALWGIVVILMSTFGINQGELPPTSDYIRVHVELSDCIDGGPC